MHNLKLTGFSAFEIIALMERRNQHLDISEREELQRIMDLDKITSIVFLWFVIFPIIYY